MEQPQEETGSYFGRSVVTPAEPQYNSYNDQNNIQYNYEAYQTSNEAYLQQDPNSTNLTTDQPSEVPNYDQNSTAYYNPFASRSNDNYIAPQVAQVTRISFELVEPDTINMILHDVDLNNSLQMNIIDNIKNMLQQNQAQVKCKFCTRSNLGLTLALTADFEYYIGTSQYHTIVSGLKQLEYVKVQELPANIVHLFINNADTSASEQWTLDDVKQRLPEELWESLYQYQRQGVLYAVKKGGKVLIGDEMGLGKTIQGTCAPRSFGHLSALT